MNDVELAPAGIPLFPSSVPAYDRCMTKTVPAWARQRFTMNHVDVDGESVPFLIGGDGPSLLLVHGLSASLDWWQFNADALARRFRVYLIDLPGFGQLGHLPEAVSMFAYTEWVNQFMDAAGLEKAHVVGHSMGGHIAIRLAATHPERVDRLVLVAPAGALPNADIEHYVLPVARLLREIPPRMIRVALRDFSRADLRATWQAGQDLVENDVLNLLPDIQAPTLLIWGGDDPIIPIALAETFLEQIPGARLVSVPDSGHMPMMDHPERFNRHVIQFLSSE